MLCCRVFSSVAGVGVCGYSRPSVNICIINRAVAGIAVAGIAIAGTT